PYNGYDGPCVYSYKYSKALQDAVKLVNNNAGKLGASGDSEEAQNKKSWYSAFFALDSVFGHQAKGCNGILRTQQQLIDDFNAQKDYGDCGTANADSDLTCGGSDDCCGNDDFLNFIKKCEHGNKFSYGYDVLQKYYSLTKECDGSCGQQADAGTRIKQLCENGYMEAECCELARDGSEYSLEKMCTDLADENVCKIYCVG
ncbi:hypothetical protein KJ780_01380, partial [Candidatus Micrarchaeota archaeon]|nr:hypothetical protein [Candidatus Micrarchaeota archaeon]